MVDVVCGGVTSELRTTGEFFGEAFDAKTYEMYPEITPY